MRGPGGLEQVDPEQRQSSHLPILGGIHVVEEDGSFLVQPVDVIPNGLVDLLAFPLALLLVNEACGEEGRMALFGARH